MIMVLPFSVKQVAVSTTTRPVTQHALVDVNKASIALMPETVISGNKSKPVPEKMISIKAVSYTHLDVYKRQA